MTETEILAFLSVVHNGTISGAAQELIISQPALSRRIASLEEQLGCTLFVRRKGQRYVELTPAGKAFVSLAQRWQALLTESAGLAAFEQVPSFKMGSVGSVCNLLLPHVFQAFLDTFPECRLEVAQHHSTECYDNMENGTLDFALISDDVFSKSVETVPAFKSHFYLVSKQDYGEIVEPAVLNAHKEVRISWTPEYNVWHDYWFGSTAKANIVIDQMMLLEHFLRHTDTWAIVPAYVARMLHERANLTIYKLTEPPPDEIIYYLEPKEAQLVNSYGREFLQLLKTYLEAEHPEITVLI